MPPDVIHDDMFTKTTQSEKHETLTAEKARMAKQIEHIRTDPERLADLRRQAHVERPESSQK